MKFLFLKSLTTTHVYLEKIKPLHISCLALLPPISSANIILFLFSILLRGSQKLKLTYRATATSSTRSLPCGHNGEVTLISVLKNMIFAA